MAARGIAVLPLILAQPLMVAQKPHRHSSDGITAPLGKGSRRIYRGMYMQ